MKYLGVAAAIRMVHLTHTPGFENLFVIRLDEHVAELANFCVGKNARRALDAVQRHETQRAAQAVAPVMILRGFLQNVGQSIETR